MQKAVVAIELACSLCPKAPIFSDISHLLTHISSKSHLSHRFKLQIRAKSEPAAKEKLDTFDYWYHDNNLDSLLAERLAAKEQKKTAKERKARVSNTSTSSKTSTAKKDQKMEQKPAQEVLAATPVFRAPVPRMHLWPTHTSSPTVSRDWEQDHMYSTPTMRRKVPNFAAAEAETRTGDMLHLQSITPRKPDESDGMAEPRESKGKKAEKKPSDSTTLKGVLWPGMDLFDSATPEMKRMRNQRKDDSVLEHMIATSNGVKPNEFVYDLNGEFHHTRDIFGPLSIENSPNQIQDLTPKKRNSRTTVQALTNISVNVPRLRARRPRKSAVAETPLKRGSASRASRERRPPPFVQQGPNSTPNPLFSFGHRYVPTLEEDEEFRLTVGGMSKKRGFGIFQDAHAPEVSPGQTESTLEDHRFDLSVDRMTRQPSDIKAANHISPTPAAKTAVRGFRKENASSGFSPSVRSRQRLTTSAPYIYPGQVFYDPILNPLYDASFAARSLFPLYSGQHTGYNEDHKPPHSSLYGQYKPIHSNPSTASPQGYSAGANNGLRMHYAD